jgi:hypothetical protein
MARYFRFHTLACLTRQGAEELAAKMPAGDDSRALRVVANRIERIMLVEFEAPARKKLEHRRDSARARGGGKERGASYGLSAPRAWRGPR